MEIKIPSSSGLATNAALTAVENEICNISSFVKKKKKKQIATQKLVKLKINLLIIIMIDILLLQNSISLQQKILMQD